MAIVSLFLLGLLGVQGLPVSMMAKTKTKSKAKTPSNVQSSACCDNPNAFVELDAHGIVIEPKVHDPEKDRKCPCFGYFTPDPQHDQCMLAAPQWEDTRLSRAWQAGCWCTNPRVTCQAYCSTQNQADIKVLAKDSSGGNVWNATTVGTEVRQALDMKEEARVQCAMGCQSRGLCMDKDSTWSPTPAPSLCAPLPAATEFFTWGGDATKCQSGGVLSYGESCQMIPVAGATCSVSKVTCLTTDGGYVAKLLPEAPFCGMKTSNPTKTPTMYPTVTPTSQPTLQPTQKPTMEPIAAPTPSGCDGYSLTTPAECAAAVSKDPALKCSYLGSQPICALCGTWVGDQANCDASSRCGYETGTTLCNYCPDLSQAQCAGYLAGGCAWTGSECKAAGGYAFKQTKHAKKASQHTAKANQHTAKANQHTAKANQHTAKAKATKKTRQL